MSEVAVRKAFDYKRFAHVRLVPPRIGAWPLVVLGLARRAVRRAVALVGAIAGGTAWVVGRGIPRGRLGLGDRRGSLGIGGVRGRGAGARILGSAIGAAARGASGFTPGELAANLRSYRNHLHHLSMALLESVESELRVHLGSRVRPAHHELLQPNHGVEVGGVIRSDPAFIERLQEFLRVSIDDPDRLFFRYGNRLSAQPRQMLVRLHTHTLDLEPSAVQAVVVLGILRDDGVGNSVTIRDLAVARIVDCLAVATRALHELAVNQ